MAMLMTGWWNRLGIVALAGVLIGASSARSPLIDAARNSDTEKLRTLLKSGAPVNAAEGDGSTALHWASYRDDLAGADLLIRAGANVNAANDLGATPLWTASQNGSAAMVKRLLQAGADPNLALMAGETPLMTASRVGNPDVVEQLLARGARPNATGARGQTALMWAVAQQHPEAVKVLLAHGADVHARSAVWNEVMGVSPHGLLEYNASIPHGGDTALMFAMRVGDLESARLLVAAGADVNNEDAWGVTATVLAAHSGFRDIVLFLLDKGADPNRAKAGFAAIHEAIMRRDEPLVTALLNHGADPNLPLKTWTPTRRTSNDYNFPPPLSGATPLWLATRFVEPAIARRLVEYGADPFVVHRATYTTLTEQAGYDQHNESTTILMAATGMGGRANSWVPLQGNRDKREALTLESVKLAVELGVDVNAADPSGRTALDAAKALKYDSVVAFLLENGAVAGKSATESSAAF